MSFRPWLARCLLGVALATAGCGVYGPPERVSRSATVDGVPRALEQEVAPEQSEEIESGQTPELGEEPETPE